MSMPGLWNQRKSEALSWLVVNAVERARNEPDTWVRPTPLDIEVQYVSEEDGWHVRLRYGRRDTWIEFASRDVDAIWRQMKLKCIDLLQRSGDSSFVNDQLGALADAGYGVKWR